VAEALAPSAGLTSVTPQVVKLDEDKYDCQISHGTSAAVGHYAEQIAVDLGKTTIPVGPLAASRMLAWVCGDTNFKVS